MNAIRTIHHVTGPSLTVAVPPELAGRQVEVIIRPMHPTEGLPPGLDPRVARCVLASPPLSASQAKELEQHPFPLRGTGGELTDPYGPAVPPEEWEVCRDDPA